MRRLTTVFLTLLSILVLGMASPAAGVATDGDTGSNGDTGTVGGEATNDARPPQTRPEPRPEPRPRPTPSAERTGGGGGGGGSQPASTSPPRHPGLTYEQCVAFLEFSEDRSACQPAAPAMPTAPAAPGAPPGPPPTVVIDPGAVAETMRNEVPVEMPRPHTSPPEGGFQLTGVPTWFWLDAGGWTPVSVRAEVPGVWVEVTATPTTVTWEPGDGSSAVPCDGPARRHPGTPGATTDCGHTYLDPGRFTITVTVTYAVTWDASTGEGGELDPLALATQLPIEVQQRQVVIDG